MEGMGRNAGRKSRGNIDPTAFNAGNHAVIIVPQEGSLIPYHQEAPMMEILGIVRVDT